MLSPVVMALSPLARLGRTLPAAWNTPLTAGRREVHESGSCPSDDVE
ncbi:hypothetical protein M2271_000362 [Streptomyces sp. LBL]|nr:hypothetical protein [Streptomyces sp. LBL]